MSAANSSWIRAAWVKREVEVQSGLHRASQLCENTWRAWKSNGCTCNGTYAIGKMVNIKIREWERERERHWHNQTQRGQRERQRKQSEEYARNKGMGRHPELGLGLRSYIISKAAQKAKENPRINRKIDFTNSWQKTGHKEAQNCTENKKIQ